MPRDHRTLIASRHTRHEGRTARSGPRGLFAAVAALAVLGAALPAAVRAHDGESAVDLLPNRASPGDTVRLVGDDLQPGDRVDFVLLTAGGPLDVGTSIVTSEGHIDASITVPELDPRIYELRVTAADGSALSTYLTVPTAAEAASTRTPSSLMPAILLGVLGIAILAVTLVGPRGGSRRRRRR